MTVTWKIVDPKYAKDGFTESAFAIAFREGAPEIAKLLSDERGFYIDKKEAEVNGYKYRVKMVNNQKGNFTFIERGQTLGEERPELIAHKAVQNGDYEKRQKDIAAAHADNLKMHDEKMASDKAITAAINNLANVLADYLKTRATKDDELIELLKATIKLLPNFRAANNMTSEIQTS